MSRISSGSLYGTLNLLVLKALDSGPMHGVEIARWIEARSGSSLEIKEGALYPALHRLRNAGFLTASWDEAPSGRRAKFYELTPDGLAELSGEVRRWTGHTRAVSRLLGLTGVVDALGG